MNGENRYLTFKLNSEIYTEDDLIKQASDAGMTLREYKGFLFEAGMEKVDPMNNYKPFIQDDGQIDLTKLPNLASGESFDAYGNVVNINKEIIQAPEGKTVEEAKVEKQEKTQPSLNLQNFDFDANLSFSNELEEIQSIFKGKKELPGFSLYYQNLMPDEKLPTDKYNKALYNRYGTLNFKEIRAKQTKQLLLKNFDEKVAAETTYLSRQKQEKLSEVSEGVGGILDFLFDLNPETSFDQAETFFQTSSQESFPMLIRLLEPNASLEDIDDKFGQEVFEGEDYTFRYFESRLDDYFDKQPKVEITHKETGKKTVIDLNITPNVIDFLPGVDKNNSRKRKILENRDKLFDFVSTTINQETIDEVKEYNKEVLGEFENSYDESLKMTQVELDVIKEEVSEISFETYRVDSEYGGSYLGGETVQPYKKELEEAKNILIQAGNQNPTKKEIEEKTRENLIRERIYDARTQKSIDFWNREDIEETDKISIFKYASMLKAELSTEELKDATIKQYAYHQHKEDFIKEQQPGGNHNIVENFLEIYNSKEKVNISPMHYSLFGIKDPSEMSEQERFQVPMVTLDNGTTMPKAMFDKGNKLFEKQKLDYEQLIQFEEELLPLFENIQEESHILEMAAKDYNDIRKFTTTLGHGFVKNILKALYGLGNLKANTVTGFRAGGLFVEETAKIQKAEGEIRSLYQDDIKFGNAFSSIDNFGRFLSQETANQIPIFAMIATGTPGIAALGLGSMQEQYTNMTLADLETGDKTSEWKKWLVSLGYGAAEVIFDRFLTLPVLRRSASMMSSGAKRELLDNGMKAYWKTYGKRSLVYDPLLETSSEGLTTITQNLITGRPITENLGHALFSGGLFGTTVSHVPFYKGLVMSKFSDYNSYNGFRDNLQELEGLEQVKANLNTQLKRVTKRGQNTENINDRLESINQQIESLGKDNQNILKDLETKMGNMDEKWFNMYNDATVQQELIRMKATQIKSDKTINSKQADLELSILKNKFDQLQEVRDDMLNLQNYGTSYGAFKNSTEQSDIDLKKELEEEVKSQYTKRGEEISEEKLDKEVRKLYNTNLINNDFKKFSGVLKEGGSIGGVDISAFQNFQTVQEAVDYINNIENLDDASKQSIIQTLEEGGHGTTITMKDADGSVTGLLPFQVVENMANDDRLETRTHELGHAIFRIAFNGGDFNTQEIAKNILEYAKNQQKGLYTMLIAKTAAGATDVKTAEEIIVNFFELVAEGKIDLKSPKNKGLGAFISNLFQSKVDMNIKGETDAITFLIGLAKKIKAGTITEADIKEIRKGDILKKIEGATTETVVQFSEAKAKQDLGEVQQAAVNDAGTFVKEDFNPNNSKIRSNLSGMINAQIINLNINRYLKEQGKKELQQQTAFELLVRNDIAKFDGRGTLYGFINGRIKFAMKDAFKNNPIIVEDFNKADLDETMKRLEAEDIDTTPLDETLTDDTTVSDAKINVLALTNKESDVVSVVNPEGDYKQVIDNNVGEVGNKIFNIPANKISNPKANITTSTKIVDVKTGKPLSKQDLKEGKKGILEPSEAKNIQDFFSDINTTKKFIKILPKENVTKKDADINRLGENIDVSRDTYGRGIGLPNRILNYFYQPKIENGKRVRSQGKTSQVPMWELKPEFRNLSDSELTAVAKKFQEDLGITKDGLTNVLPTAANRSKIGQLLKGAAVVMSQQASLSGAQRIKETQLKKTKEADALAKVKQEIADITTGQADVAFSEVQKIINFNTVFQLETTGVDQLLDINKIAKTFNLTTEKGRQDFLEKIKTDLLPIMPKEFWFTVNKNGKVTNDVFTYSHNNYGNFSMSETFKGSGIYKNPAQRDAYNKFRQDIRALASDTDVKFGKPIDGVDFTLTKGYSTIFGNKKNYLQKMKNVDDIKAWNDNISKIHSEMWKRFNSVIAKDKNMASLIGTYLKLTANDTQSWHRLGAQIAGYSTSITARGEGKAPNIEFEHAMPATSAYLYLLHVAVKGGNFSTAYGLVVDNYKLIVLDKAMDDKLRNAKTQSGYSLMKRMPDNWDVVGNNWWERYFNEIVFNVDGKGIDPSSIVDLNGNTFGSKFNINAKGQSSAVISVSNNIKNASKAQLKARLDNSEKPRGMTAWDFDDTLATTKSGVRATVPNPDGTPQPNRKVIFLAGGAGSGKSNVVKKLGLESQGFKIVNSDISLEWLKKNSGLPANMNDLTKEQLSTLGKLQYQSRQISKGKMMKYQGNADGVVVDGTGGSINAMTKLVNEFKDKGYDVSMVFVETSLETALDRNRVRKERSLTDKIVTKNHEAVQGNKDGFKTMFAERFMEVKTDNLTQADPMPTELTQKMDDFVSGYKKLRLDAEQFATEGADVLAQGGEFDFSEFNVVTEGARGPMFNKAMSRAGKYGTADTYVLTARPQASAEPIQQFLASQGLNIPIENITGLGNSTGEAKAMWMLGKFSEGYNNMYFADDAMQNVKAVKDVLDQLDIKSKVVQAKVDFSRKMKSTMDQVLTNPKTFKLKQKVSISNVKNVNRLNQDGVYADIQFSKKHRGEYENLISKNRPDLVKEGLVSQTVDQMFDLVNGLDIPASKRRKYEKIMTKWLATSVMKLPEDNYKLQDSVELAEKNNLDVFSYNNPNEIIEKYAGKAKEKPTDPDTIELFVKDKSKTNKKYGITEYVVTEDRENNEFYIDDGQQAVRKIVDTHWGPKSNPWCIIARDKDGTGGMTDAMENWEEYSDSEKRIVFQNGKLLAFYANDLYWDRMDNDTDAPVINIKEGRVTKKIELVPVGKNKVDEFVMEVRTVSEDGNTVTTEVVGETDSSYEAGTKIVENRVNGITVKKTRSTSDKTSIEWGFEPGSIQEVQNYNKKGELTSSIFYQEAGVIGTINYAEEFGGITESEIVERKGDIIGYEGGGEYFAQINLAKQGIKNADPTVITEIGWEMDGKLEDVITTSSNGEIRVDLKKILKIDSETQGIPSNIQFSKKTDVDINKILEQTKNVDAKKRFSNAQAKIRGSKYKFTGLVPPSAQDLNGLLYSFLAPGKLGEQQFAKLKEALVDPFARGTKELNTSRQKAADDFRNLLKQYPKVKKELNDKLDDYEGFEGNNFTVDQAIRVYLWSKAGFDVPGLSARDLKALNDFVNKDSELRAFADAVGLISKKDGGYVEPSEYWLIENINSDLMSDGSIGDKRAEFLADWIENKNTIFGEWENGKLVGENINKIEATYGSKFREALEDVLYRMETGRNRPRGGGRLMNEYQNWVNGSVGAIMFFNVRSAVLQTISAFNYINWSDNNPVKAAAAFANQKQFWSDFVFLFNSDFLKQRRSGNKRGINEAELSQAVAGKGAAEQAKAAIRYLLKIGFLPTQIADSFAIASGGSSFYRNRVKSLMKKGMSQADAEAQAFLDFQETTEVSQQSARPDLISQQQANPLGRLILAFANTPMQYGRIMDKAFRDIANNRGDFKSNTSKIIYYGFIQGVIFTALQSALFAVIGSEDDEEKEEMLDKKSERMLNSMIDTWFTTFGYGGKAISVTKNTVMEYLKQRDKDVDDNFMTKSDHAYTLLQALSFSPPIGSKARKIYQATQSEKFNRDIIKERGFKIDNPVWGAIGNVIEGATNLPLGRMFNKLKNLENAMDSRHETWKRIALVMGWNTWDLGMEDPDIVALDVDIKERKKIEKEQERVKKKYEEKKKKLIEKYPDLDEKEIDIKIESEKYYPLRKYEQIELLKKLDLSDKEIKNLKKESDRAEKINELYKDNKEVIDNYLKNSETKSKEDKDKEQKKLKPKKEKPTREANLYKLKKKDQLNLLLELGLGERAMFELKYEKDRVNKILELEKKSKK